MTRTVTLTSTAIGLFLALACGPPAIADDTPAWEKPLPGTAALSSSEYPVCDTAQQFRDWLNKDTRAGCRDTPADISVVIGAVVFDPLKDREPGTTYGRPLVEVHSSSKQIEGYTLLFGIHPVVPPGAVFHVKREGNATINLAPSKDADLFSGPDLGVKATVKVLRYDPTGGFNFYVRVMDGPHAGKTGWIFGGEAKEGLPISMFDGAVVDVPKPIDHVQTKIYTLEEKERAFTDKYHCSVFYGQKPFMTLTDSPYGHGSFYDYPAGTKVLVIEDNGTGFVVISDDSGHRGCVSAVAVPGYLIP